MIVVTACLALMTQSLWNSYSNQRKYLIFVNNCSQFVQVQLQPHISLWLQRDLFPWLDSLKLSTSRSYETTSTMCKSIYSLLLSFVTLVSSIGHWQGLFLITKSTCTLELKPFCVIRKLRNMENTLFFGCGSNLDKGVPKLCLTSPFLHNPWHSVNLLLFWSL